VGLILIGICSVQLGAGIAASLFDSASPTTLVWLRLLTSAVVVVAFARPRLYGRSRAAWLAALGFGACLALMNWSIYQSFDRIPLGIAVAIELVGPLGVALAGSRRRTDLAWVGLAALGVVLLGREPGSLTWAGVGFALVAGASWAAYILLSRRTGRLWPGLDGLAMASSVGALLLTVPALALHHGDLGSGRIWLLGAAIGVLSSVVPYSCELIALRTVPAHIFGVLMSLEPAAAALSGLLLVHQHLGLPEWLALVCVIGASVGITRGARETGPSPSPEPL
jgi:inner membrane transporter RhtA